MRELGGSRYIIKPSTVAAVDDLYDASPNFHAVIDDLRKYLALAVAGNEAVQFIPHAAARRAGPWQDVLRQAPRPCARDRFRVRVDELADRGLGADRRVGAMAQRPARQGRADADRRRIRQSASSCSTRSTRPAAMRATTRWARCTACSSATPRAHFKDEFIDVDIDASHILWVATANDESSIPEPILNRMNVYEIERPDADGSRKIALAVYREILDAHRWPFPPEPSETRARPARLDPAARHAQAAARRVRHRPARRSRPPGARRHRQPQALRPARARRLLTRRGVQTSRGKLLCSSRDSARSASTTPPVWQRAQ